MLLFVSIWNREDTEANNKGKTEQDKKWGWDSFVRACLSLSTSPWKSIPQGTLPKYVSGMLVRSGLTTISFFMLQRTALRTEGEEGYHWKNDDERKWLVCWNPLFSYIKYQNLEQACRERFPDNHFLELRETVILNLGKLTCKANNNDSDHTRAHDVQSFLFPYCRRRKVCPGRPC